MLCDFAFIGIDVHHIAHVQIGYIRFEGQGAGIFHGIEENRRDFAADTDTALSLVGNIRNVITGKPQHRVGGGLTG